jgi:hypothetical protein
LARKFSSAHFILALNDFYDKTLEMIKPFDLMVEAAYPG